MYYLEKHLSFITYKLSYTIHDYTYLITKRYIDNITHEENYKILEA